MAGITRRAFVGAAAAPLVIPRSALGDDKRDAAGSRLGLGFIGMGTMARGHLNHFLGQKDVQVLAVCDTDQTRRDSAQKQVEQRYGQGTKTGTYNGCTAYADFRDLLRRPDIDAVLIATPDHWHAIPCLEAIRAGKDIYCEKPLTLTILEAKRLVEAVRKHDRVFQTGSQQRSDKEFRTACELVRAGRIGKLEAVYVNVGGPSRPCDLPEEKPEPGCDWEMWLGPAPLRPYNAALSPRGVHKHFPDWRSYREYSGGMMTDWGAHHFDIAQWGLGMDESGPVEVVAPKDPKAGKGVKYVYANGVPVIHADHYAPGKPVNGVAFIGSNGNIFVNRGFLKSEPDGLVKEAVSEKERLYASPGHQRDWLNCIKTRKRPICDVEVGARSVTVCHLGNIAYWTGRSFKWDPKAWQFVDAPAEVVKWIDRERRDPWQLPQDV